MLHKPLETKDSFLTATSRSYDGLILCRRKIQGGFFFATQMDLPGNPLGANPEILFLFSDFFPSSSGGNRPPSRGAVTQWGGSVSGLPRQLRPWPWHLPGPPRLAKEPAVAFPGEQPLADPARAVGTVTPAVPKVPVAPAGRGI